MLLNRRPRSRGTTGLPQAIAEGPTLYADLANPVSNSVYRRVGYRAVTEILSYEFVRYRGS